MIDIIWEDQSSEESNYIHFRGIAIIDSVQVTLSWHINHKPLMPSPDSPPTKRHTVSFFFNDQYWSYVYLDSENVLDLMAQLQTELPKARSAYGRESKDHAFSLYTMRDYINRINVR
jgi:hypothetical protein